MKNHATYAALVVSVAAAPIAPVHAEDAAELAKKLANADQSAYPGQL